MKRLIILLILIVPLFYSLGMADTSYYSEIRRIYAGNKDIALKHFHDWKSKSAIDKLESMITGDQNPFTPLNDYAYIECYDRRTKEFRFKKPTPALTFLYISPDSKYIIGLSNIKTYNPYQLVVFDIDGNLIYKMHIASEEAELTIPEYQLFKKKYPQVINFLIEREGIFFIGKKVYVDFYRMYMSLIAGTKAWNYLINKRKPSHLIKNFGGKFPIWIFWYKEPDPKIELKYNKQNQLIGISLLDNKGVRFEIPIPNPEWGSEPKAF